MGDGMERSGPLTADELRDKVATLKARLAEVTERAEAAERRVRELEIYTGVANMADGETR